MPRPVAAQARPIFRIYLRYDDGVEGEIDLSDLAGRGVFKAWEDAGVFDSVQIKPYRALAWDGDIELCADELYMHLT
ncbi:MAG: DUF2442 domain-containing protein [Candidatus Latescibacteria bacterium]|nr:DUF2442 domain-containing protein [Candidatus Latescibacterota bacterium]